MDVWGVDVWLVMTQVALKSCSFTQIAMDVPTPSPQFSVAGERWRICLGLALNLVLLARGVSLCL